MKAGVSGTLCHETDATKRELSESARLTTIERYQVFCCAANAAERPQARAPEQHTISRSQCAATFKKL